MTTVLLSVSINTLCGIWVSAQLGALARLSVHPASPVLLTKNGPLGARIEGLGSVKQPRLRTYLKFENRSEALRPRYL